MVKKPRTAFGKCPLDTPPVQSSEVNAAQDAIGRGIPMGVSVTGKTPKTAVVDMDKGPISYRDRCLCAVCVLSKPTRA